ncbi:hypothetical protein HAX54_029141 [Datura stramonium]|uniref:Uncharacterized protein n=1 Tax=Datura stramonium TaxID=4076 RepID=A0ABS8V5C4_DATST|nr:hypothetical protein [Datura stramonium]
MVWGGTGGILPEKGKKKMRSGGFRFGISLEEKREEGEASVFGEGFTVVRQLSGFTGGRRWWECGGRERRRRMKRGEMGEKRGESRGSEREIGEEAAAGSEREERGGGGW